ncbi:adenine deaminase [candidate division WOR-3 bacterium JGI_Cruoil_03_51_56]|uniref:Adenine deaminase n=1 Tax=candidate division WOR-3 bacterium JGI_Cruoil_03_51_56 TaxID=1973747 RepID=A0A235BRU6_UNCW3|nr:MAG: adenine deaminase [candidate division WOR-3 bacterium JGI_Cruoil_03_51_56]
MKQKKDREVAGLQSLVAVARGDEPADLLLRNGQVVDVFTGEVRRANVVLKDGLIAGVGFGYEKARKVLDISGQFLAPGFIDGHIHIESSLLPVHEFARLALVHGTTAVVADPHEIANVLGIKGVKYMLKASKGLPLDVFLMVPSCVPSTDMETSGARLSQTDISRLLKLDRILGLAEMMNFPGVIFGDETVLGKIVAAKRAGRMVDGHAPAVVGQWLQAYAGAGIESDHECTGRDEATQKLRSGMRLMVREGSAARNLAGLLPVINDFNLRRCCFVTDDKHPEELLRDGHMDAILRKAVSQGMNPVAAIQMVTLNPAEYFGLRRRGAVAPGWRADLVVLNNLQRFRVIRVLKAGKPVVRDGKVLIRLPAMRDRNVTGTIKPGRLMLNRFAMKAEGDMCRVIRLVPDQIVTEQRFTRPTIVRGYVKADPERDLLKLAVLERHKGTGRTGLGLVSGFGLKQGALGTTVAHDSHNMIIIGTNDEDMLVAAKELKRIGGGYVAVARGRVAARLRLPIAGLMSNRKAETVVSDLNRLLAKARIWGSRLANPFIALSFLALPVIPELKLTDRGLVDVGKFKLVNFFCTE